MTEFAQPPCCKRPRIANMDHVRGSFLDQVLIVNRCCLTCFAHWYGPLAGEVRQYTKAEWDQQVKDGALRDEEECRRWRETIACPA